MTYFQHPEETSLALYATGDLPFWERVKTGVHANRCAECRALIKEFRDDQSYLKSTSEKLPDGIKWDRLSAEMTANIHLGLEAGECVTPRDGQVMVDPLMDDDEHRGIEDRRLVGMLWRPLGIAAAVVLLLGSAWWLNMPQSDNERLARAFGSIFGSEASPVVVDESGPLVEASSTGIELRENGSSWGMTMEGSNPVATSVSMPGSVSASYVDDDTFQVTIATMYTQ